MIRDFIENKNAYAIIKFVDRFLQSSLVSSTVISLYQSVSKKAENPVRDWNSLPSLAALLDSSSKKAENPVRDWNYLSMLFNSTNTSIEKSGKPCKGLKRLFNHSKVDSKI